MNDSDRPRGSVQGIGVKQAAGKCTYRAANENLTIAVSCAAPSAVAPAAIKTAAVQSPIAAVMTAARRFPMGPIVKVAAVAVCTPSAAVRMGRACAE